MATDSDILYQFRGQNLEEVTRELNFFVRYLGDVLDRIQGLRGEPTFFSPVNAQGHPLKNVGEPVDDTDAEIRGRSLRRSNGSDPFDAQGMPIANVGRAISSDQAVPLGQMREELTQGTVLQFATTAPPKVGDTSQVGADTFIARGQHTHAGLNLDDAQTATGEKTLDLAIIGRLRTKRLSLTVGNGANNDIAITDVGIVRLTGPTAAYSVTGIANGVDGRVLFLWNNSAQNFTLANESGSSVAANRVVTHTGADIVTVGEGIFILFYSSSDNRWHVASVQP